MKVITLKDGLTTDYYFDPEHSKSVWEFYSNEQAKGSIDAFSVIVGIK